MRTKRARKTIGTASCMHRAEEEGSDSLISEMLCPSPARSSLLQASDTESHEHACLLVVFGVFSLSTRYMLQKQQCSLAALPGWDREEARQGLPLTQTASENSNKSSPLSPPCVRRKEVGFPDVQLYQVTTCERPPCSPQRGHSPIVWALVGSPPHPTWPLPPQVNPALVGGQACGSARLIPASWPGLARLPWQSFTMSVGPAVPPSSSLSGARATSGRPWELPDRGEVPRGPAGSWAQARH